MPAADGVFGGTHFPQNRDLDLAGESRVGLDLLGDVAGQLAFGLTDTDDALIELEAGKPVKIVFPDSSEDGVGTLLLPNTLAVVKGAPHPRAAVQLIDYLISPEVEAKPAAGPSAQIPLNRQRHDRGVKRVTNGAGRKCSDRKRSAGAARAARPSALLDTRIVYCGDCLDQLGKLPNGCVDLIYIDPPFNSNQDYEVFWGETRIPVPTMLAITTKVAVDSPNPRRSS